jgi:crotonobetainyl-CoA:carnitine CoA-transferase CaiB-like acyl-CoA transferase
MQSLPPVLKGIRVLDLTSIIAGPTATMILAYLGADIIKVERIDGGDDSRRMGPHLGQWSPVFVPLNRGKRSIAVDISKPSGRDLILRLARTSDVFVENFRGGKMAALGLDEAAVKAENPQIIYASLSAYGNVGPDAMKPGYEALAQARSGIISVTGLGPDSPPTRAGVSIIDMSAGMWMAIGILAGLIQRRTAGVGQRVDTSLFETGIILMFNQLLHRQFSGTNPTPQGAGYAGFAPYDAFMTADGRIMLGTSNDRIFRRLCEAIEHVEWAEDPRFLTNVLRVKNRNELDEKLQNIFRRKSTARWTTLLDAHDVPVAVIQNVEQVLNDPQLEALGQLEDVTLPGGTNRPIAVPRPPLKLSLARQEPLGAPPLLGEHGEEILAEAGYSKTDVDRLIEDGICKLERRGDI